MKKVFILFFLIFGACSKTIPDIGGSVGDLDPVGGDSGSETTGGTETTGDTTGGSVGGTSSGGESTGSSSGSDGTDLCAGVDEAFVSDKVIFSLSPSGKIFSGETVAISWSVDLDDPTVSLLQNNSAISSDVSGGLTLTPTEETWFKLTVSYCGYTVSKTRKISFLNFDQKQIPSKKGFIYSSEEKKSLSFGERNFSLSKITLWLGGSDGALYKSDTEGETWEKVLKSLPGSEAYNLDDGSDIRALNKIEECGEVLFIGSQEGFVYRSFDEGKTVVGWDESVNEPIVWVTDADQSGLSISFIIQDPDDETGQTLIIGSSGGVVLQGCDNQGEFAFLQANDLNDTFPKNTNRDFKSSGLFAGVSFQKKVFFADDEGLWVTDDSFYPLALTSGLEVDDEITWEPVDEIGNQVEWVRVFSGKIFAGTTSGIYSSEDGETWEKISEKVSGYYFNSKFDFYWDNTFEVSRKSTGQILSPADVEKITQSVSLGFGKIGFLGEEAFYILDLNSGLSLERGGL